MDEMADTVTCRRCGREGLHWEQRLTLVTGVRWRLCDKRGVHHCKVRPLKGPPGQRPRVVPYEKLPAGCSIIWSGDKEICRRP